VIGGLLVDFERAFAFKGKQVVWAGDKLVPRAENCIEPVQRFQTK